ncbi:dimethylaniline monooxygenase [N-oxide-forming] 2-like [Ptychodera flava]|uniref:dimethylaniline monooxygenase [N-oxide-forming] 2-like n=1 Tax=Ptychodera flava TaxID=63121 RepID=UPI003969FD0B
MKDGAWVVLRMGPGAMTLDQLANKRFNHMIPDSLRQFIVEKLVQSKIDHEKLGLKSSRRMFSGSVMVNDDIHNRIFCGSLKCKPEIQSFSKHGVKFVDGSEVNDLDAVVFATGYNIEFPFIDGSILADNFKDLELYFHIFPPRLEKNTLALIGGIAAVGAQGPVFELQARWATRVFKGVASLPDQETMLEDVRTRKENLCKRFGKPRVFFPPVPYQEEIADQIGVRPKFWRVLLTDPKLAFRLVFGPCYPASYRLVGPGASWEKARETIFKAPENMLYSMQTVRPNTVAKSTKGISMSFLLKLLIVIILPLLLSFAILSR